MEEGHLHLLITPFGLSEKHHAPLVVAAIDPLNESAAFQNFVIVPLDLKHAPVLLDIDSGQALLVPPLFSLTKH